MNRTKALLANHTTQTATGFTEKKADGFNAGLLDAIEFAYQNDIWPSARNIATLMGYKRPKLNGRMNRERKRIIHEIYDL